MLSPDGTSPAGQWLEVDFLASLPQSDAGGADAYHIGYLARASPSS